MMAVVMVKVMVAMTMVLDICASLARHGSLATRTGNRHGWLAIRKGGGMLITTIVHMSLLLALLLLSLFTFYDSCYLQFKGSHAAREPWRPDVRISSLLLSLAMPKMRCTTSLWRPDVSAMSCLMSLAMQMATYIERPLETRCTNRLIVDAPYHAKVECIDEPTLHAQEHFAPPVSLRAYV